MNEHQNFSRKQFMGQVGAIVSCASAAALLSQNSARANENAPTNSGKMKWCMYTYTLFGSKMKRSEIDIVEMCRRTRDLGIDGLDILGSGYNKSWKEFKEIADSFGIKVVCYTEGIKILESPDEAMRKKGLEIFKTRLAVAHELGTKRIMMNQGGLSKDSKQNRKFLIESLKEALPIAKSEGIEVTIEHHNSPKAPFRTSADFNEALAVVPDLRIAYDCGNNYRAGEDPIQGYLNNQDQITHVHFKDFFKNGGGTCAPGLGLIDFPKLIKTMKGCGYAGYINLEMGGPSPSGWEVYEKSMELLGPLIV